jgi:hypothetical protein
MRRARDGGKRAIGGISSVGIRKHGKDIAGAMDHALNRDLVRQVAVEDDVIAERQDAGIISQFGEFAGRFRKVREQTATFPYLARISPTNVRARVGLSTAI